MFTIALCLVLKTVTCSEEIDHGVVEITNNSSTFIGKKLFTLLENKPYAAFWKIPYADPPLYDLRFKTPKQSPAFLNNIRNDYSEYYNITCSTFYSEDCLYLSVFAPVYEEDYTLPVLVWLHENSGLHEPDLLIDNDIIVVIVSYRVGIFGFLNTDDDFAPGNMGAKDVLMALRWIRQNIHTFKGDINRVTLSGSGSAGTIVASSILSPAGDDLFSRVIIQSNSALSPADYRNYNFEIANKLYWRLGGSFEKFDRRELYQKLSEATTKQLLSVSHNLFDSTEVRDTQRLINSFGPTTETFSKHYFMNKTPLEVYERKMSNNNIDIMIGYITLESIRKLTGLASNRKLLPTLNYNFQYTLPFEGKYDGYGTKRYREIREKIKNFYFLNGTITEHSFRRYAKYVSDQIVYPILKQARLHTDVSCNNVYAYRFAFNGRLNAGWNGMKNSTKILGTTTGDEICYLFRCKSFDEVYTDLKTSNERRFIKKITRLWANFVKFGNPTHSAVDPILEDLQWAPLKRKELNVLNLDQNMRMVRAPEAKRLQFWDELREEYFVAKNAKDEL